MKMTRSLVILTLTCVLLCGTALAAHPCLETGLPDSVKLMLTELENTLQACEDVWGTELWTLDHVDRWVRGGELADLDLARQACLLVSPWLYRYQSPEDEPVLTDEAIDEVIILGYEPEMVWGLTGTATRDIPDKLGYIQELYMLMEEWQAAEQQAVCGRLSEALRMELESSARDAAWAVNYTLLKMDEPTGRQLYAAYQAAYPTVFGAVEGWVSDPEEIETMALANSDAYIKADPLLWWQAASIAADTHMAEHQQNGTVPELIANAHPDDLLPKPAWYNAGTAMCACVMPTAQGHWEQLLYTPGMTLSPCCFYIVQNGVSLEDVQAYLALVAEDWDVTPYDDELWWSLKKNGATVWFQLDEGMAIITTFVSGTRFGSY